MGQVGTWVLRWNGFTEDFQEECYNISEVVQDEFQAVQGQIAWVARCPILGDFRQSPIPALFRDLHSEVSSGHVSPPPLEPCSSRDSFVSFWEELNTIASPALPPIEQEGGDRKSVV